MWATEEKAITDFRSVIFKQVRPTNLIPIMETPTATLDEIDPVVRLESRITPNPPSFNSTPAKIIDPYTGAFYMGQR